MSLVELCDWLADGLDSGALELHGDVSDVEVTGVSLSSLRVQPGDLYAALPGARSHGIDYVGEAVQAGAVAVITDHAGALAVADGLQIPVAVVAEPRRLLGRLAARIHRDPAASMRMIGVTGTQGKTTTTRLAEQGMEQAGLRAAVIGTVGTRVAGVEVHTRLTTPEAPDLHGLFATMREQRIEVCAMEVSSHALVMGRIDGVLFDVAVFLNLGRDHLDFHDSVEEYYAAKASLFTAERARRGLVNLDDEHGRRLAQEAAIPIRTFSLRDPDADWSADEVRTHPGGSDFTIVGPDGHRYAAGCRLAGGFNVANTLAAVAACAEVGLDPGLIAEGIRNGPGVPGRLERVLHDGGFEVVVDYAHKPDAVEAAIGALRPLTDSRVIVVLGAGGERDPGKRPIMAEIAGRLADVLIVTDDNPRTEDPAAIRAAMLAGVRRPRGQVLEIGDRRTAIGEAIRRAHPGDMVLIAGKGHETGQEIDGVVHPFDDREVAREILADLR